MGRFSYEDADKYGSNGTGGSYFKLEGDGDVAKVRLLGRDMNDFPGYACHEVEIDGRRRLVNCLREYNDPINVCPMCANGEKVIAKVFIPLFNVDADEVQMWERGKSFFRTLSGYCARHKNVVSYVTEIERQGKPRDTKTTYQLYEADGPDDTTLEDFADEIPEVLGRYVLDKTAEEMEYYVEHESFPDNEGKKDRDEAPVRRRAGRAGRRRSSDDEEF